MAQNVRELYKSCMALFNPGDRRKADVEVRTLNLRAKDNYTRLRTQARRLVEMNQKVKAAKLLKRERLRFEKTDSYAELEKLIQVLEQ